MKFLVFAAIYLILSRNCTLKEAKIDWNIAKRIALIRKYPDSDGNDTI